MFSRKTAIKLFEIYCLSKNVANTIHIIDQLITKLTVDAKIRCQFQEGPTKTIHTTMGGWSCGSKCCCQIQ